MTDHKSLPVHGYAAQPMAAVDLVNYHKVQEEMILRRLDQLPELDPSIDKRWLAVARTHIEQGFMAMNRAVFRPNRIHLED
jgi:hypothetical protein